MRTTTFNPLLSIDRYRAMFLHVRLSKDGHREEIISIKKHIKGYKLIRQL